MDILINFLLFIVEVTITWYKQEAEIANHIKQDGLPALDALTLCFRFKPLEIGNSNPQGNKYLISISDPGKCV